MPSVLPSACSRYSRLCWNVDVLLQLVRLTVPHLRESEIPTSTHFDPSMTTCSGLFVGRFYIIYILYIPHVSNTLFGVLFRYCSSPIISAVQHSFISLLVQSNLWLPLRLAFIFFRLLGIDNLRFSCITVFHLPACIFCKFRLEYLLLRS